jgi:putative thioredoxin
MTASPFAIDVGSNEFEANVVRRSHELPVLVDFWAAWCGPCKILMPVLAKLADEYGGKFLLAKVDTEAERELAARFQIRSIPTVQLFRNGTVVDGFMGALPEKDIRALLDRYLPRASDAAVTRADALLFAGRTEEALRAIEDAARSDPGDDRVAILRIRLLLSQSRLDDAAQAIAALPAARRTEPEVVALQTRLDFARVAAEAPSPATLDRTIADNPADLDARLRFAAGRILAGDYETGLANLLEIVRRNRRFREDVARKLMLQAFGLLGNDDVLVKKYRSLLASAIN